MWRDTLGLRTLKVMAVVLVVGGAAFVLYLVPQVLLSGFLACLLASGLVGASRWTAGKLSISRGWALLLVVALLLLGAAGLGWLAFQPLLEQVSAFVSEAPATLQGAVERWPWLARVRESVPPMGDWLSYAPTLFSSGMDLAVNTAVVVAMTLYLAYEPDWYWRIGLSLVPPAHRDRAHEVLDRMAETLRTWLLGRLLAMAAIGCLELVGLELLGVPLALFLAVLSALLSFIPNFGPILAALPAFLMASQKGLDTVLWVFALKAGVQFVESYLLTPMIQRDYLALAPAGHILFQLLMGLLLGGSGLVVATPLLACLVVLVQMLYLEDVLGQKTSQASEDKEERRSAPRGQPQPAG